jgi:hypothetical protein
MWVSKLAQSLLSKLVSLVSTSCKEKKSNETLLCVLSQSTWRMCIAVVDARGRTAEVVGGAIEGEAAEICICGTFFHTAQKP